MKIYNTLNRTVETFEPHDPNRVTLYVCGPTVYNYIHIGNARTFLVFDLLARTLKRRYPNVVYARNITDIDDKINAAAREMGASIGSITARFDAAFVEDMSALGLLVPDAVPYATSHIPQIVAMIERLIESGHAYAAEGHVLFSVSSFPDYGKLSRRDPEEMLAGARIDVAPYKRDGGDFVLWKPSDDTLPGWDSPWGRGRPGWHIECSAMAEAHLGETIDLHGGGMDLQFPHHENEIAQSQCAHGDRIFARYWMHSGMLNLGGSKMSKSLGNTFRVHDLLKQVPAEALRYALLSGHYRQPLDWSEGLIEQSVRTLDRLYGTLRDLGDVSVAANVVAIPSSIEDALDDDLDTPRVLAELAGLGAAARMCRISLSAAQGTLLADEIDETWLAKAPAKQAESKRLLRDEAIKADPRRLQLAQLQHDAAKDRDKQGFLAALREEISYLTDLLRTMKAALLGAGLAIGLLQDEPKLWFTRGASDSDDMRVQTLIDERAQAKRNRDFKRADEIRKQLDDEGIVLEDTAQGVRWSRKRI